MQSEAFGSCCKDLSEAMTVPPHPLLRVEESGVLYLTVGYTETDAGTAWFDQAVLFCPFCGAPLQSSEEIRKKTFGTT